MKTKDIRESFLDFFQSKHTHTIVKSASLVPAGDPTLLFTNAGMVPFKDCFLGAEKRAYTRATSCQKCLRISGKHNDLENVGRTARHHTFFEMLGNFSFGDYFKPDAIRFAWEYLTETLALPKERLWVTIFEDDDEAESLWKELTDVDPSRILRCGEKDNFWSMGETGPCGPCSEIHYYLGEDLGIQSEEDFRLEDGRYLEIWNLVFMQFNRSADGSLDPLPKPSVDTGMGLERIAAVKQGVLANYDTDEFQAIITFTGSLCDKPYVGKTYDAGGNTNEQHEIDVAFRVVADHARAAAFLLADGVMPGSDGRGYVVRRLIRRACRHGRNLGFGEPFLYRVCGKVVELLGETYPELTDSADKIEKLIQAEERKFIETLDTGLTVLSKEVAALSERSARVLSGEVAFLLHDTYGFPLDLTEDIVSDSGFTVDTEGFAAAMDAQRERSRSARAEKTELMLQRAVKPLETSFVGYDGSNASYESSVVGIFTEAGEQDSVSAGAEIAISVSETPFYAESGGQIGDTGSIGTPSGSIEVIDTQKATGGTIVHIGRVTEGEVSLGQSARLEIDTARRDLLRRNHSATHLLHFALRNVLGDHIAQAGSRVSEHSLRFDFSHFESIAPAQLLEVQQLVNQEIRNNYEVLTDVLDLEDAKKRGAMALFGEKYGERVRVVEIGPNSLELCGGTHVGRAGDIGICMITSEGSVAAGIRRIEAITGTNALRQIGQLQNQLESLASLLHASAGDVEDKLERTLERMRDLEKQLSRYEQKANVSRGQELSDQAVTRDDGTQVLSSVLEEVSPKQLRELADDLKQRLGSGCIALGSVQEGKAILLTAVTDDLIDRYHAGNLVKELSKIVGARGGGRADMAQAGGGDPARLRDAIARFQELIE